MADTSLDDFFAKKDKSKRKSRGGIASATATGASPQVATEPSTTTKKTAVAAGNDEKNSATKPGDGGDRPAYGVGDRPNNGPEPRTAKGKLEEDEWRELEDLEAKDYSGLKIQNLQISDLRDEEQERIRSEEYNEDGEETRSKESSGPWNRTGLVTVVAEPTPLPPPVEEPTVKPSGAEDEESSKSSRAYVPPAMRSGGAASQQSISSSAVSKSKRKFAPKLDSEEHFPSLSAATEVRSGRKSDSSTVAVGFEAVKRGSRPVYDDPSNRGPKLSLGNKFDALSRGGGAS